MKTFNMPAVDVMKFDIEDVITVSTVEEDDEAPAIPTPEQFCV